MPDLTQVLVGLQTYPVWVRMGAFAWIAVGLVGYPLLVAFAPPRTLAITDVRRVELGESGNSLALEVLLRNATGETIQISALVLELFAESKPTGGLQSSQQLDGEYVIAGGEAAGDLLAGKRDELVRHRIQIARPFAGSSYTEVTIPVSRAIEDKKADRFALAVEASGVVSERHASFEVSIIYNDNQRVSSGARSLLPQ